MKTGSKTAANATPADTKAAPDGLSHADYVKTHGVARAGDAARPVDDALKSKPGTKSKS